MANVNLIMNDWVVSHTSIPIDLGKRGENNAMSINIAIGEKLDKNLIKKATKYIRAADMLIIGGTSLVVNPAVGLAHEFREGKLVLINLGLTPFDDRADIVIHDKIGTVMSQL